MKLFEVMVWYESKTQGYEAPTTIKTDYIKVGEPTQIITKTPLYILANDEKHANAKVSKEIDSKWYEDALYGGLHIEIRPFCRTN